MAGDETLDASQVNYSLGNETQDALQTKYLSDGVPESTAPLLQPPKIRKLIFTNVITLLRLLHEHQQLSCPSKTVFNVLATLSIGEAFAATEIGYKAVQESEYIRGILGKFIPGIQAYLNGDDHSILAIIIGHQAGFVQGILEVQGVRTLPKTFWRQYTVLQKLEKHLAHEHSTAVTRYTRRLTFVILASLIIAVPIAIAEYNVTMDYGDDPDALYGTKTIEGIKVAEYMAFARAFAGGLGADTFTTMVAMTADCIIMQIKRRWQWWFGTPSKGEITMAALFELIDKIDRLDKQNQHYLTEIIDGVIQADNKPELAEQLTTTITRTGCQHFLQDLLEFASLTSAGIMATSVGYTYFYAGMHGGYDDHNDAGSMWDWSKAISYGAGSAAVVLYNGYYLSKHIFELVAQLFYGFYNLCKYIIGKESKVTPFLRALINAGFTALGLHLTLGSVAVFAEHTIDYADGEAYHTYSGGLGTSLILLGGLIALFTSIFKAIACSVSMKTRKKISELQRLIRELAQIISWLDETQQAHLHNLLFEADEKGYQSLQIAIPPPAPPGEPSQTSHATTTPQRSTSTPPLSYKQPPSDLVAELDRCRSL